MNKIWHKNNTDSCPSCLALDGQVHPAEVWDTWLLAPKSFQLYCGPACHCALADTDEPERGNLETVPLRMDVLMQTSPDPTPAGSPAPALPTPGAVNQQITINAQLSKTPTGYEVLTINAGVGNAWNFGPRVIEKAALLWHNVPCYVDHEGTADKSRHSAQDLGGYFTGPIYDPKAQGIRATLKLRGPAASTLQALAEAYLENPDLPIGFSADIEFTANGRDVVEITKVRSTDAVLHPARGGKFLRALLSQKGETMPDELITPEGATQQPAPVSDRLKANEQALATILGEAERQAKLQEAVEQSDKTLAATCGYLLTASLQASKLPDVVQKRLRAQFQDKVFQPAELQKAVDEARAEVSELTGAQSINGPARVSGMFASDDQIKAAVADLFGIERDPGLEKVQAARLSGIRELYMGLTADYDLHGAYDPVHALFQLTTTNFSVIVKNALNKSLVNHWKEFGKAGYEWWKPVVTIEPFTSLNDVTWMIFGTLGSLPTISEGGEYTPLKLGDGGETASFVKRGGYVGLTLETIDRDDTKALKKLPRELAFAGIREISAAVAALFTANSNVGPTLADGGALFNSTAVTTAGGHANLLTTALGTDYTAWDAVAQAMYNQPMLVANETGYYGTGKKMGIDPKFCLVPRALRNAANNLFIARGTPTAPNVDYYGQVIPITVPDWTDATDFAAVADPALLPGIMIGTRFGLMPEIFIAGNETDPAVFMNDESRIKVRHFSAIGVCDFRPLHKSNVSG